MKWQLLVIIGFAALMSGCAAMQRDNMGAAADQDRMQAGGSARAEALPHAVRQTLATSYPHEKIADVRWALRNGERIYAVEFIRRGGNPVVTIRDDGHVIQEIGLAPATARDRSDHR